MSLLAEFDQLTRLSHDLADQLLAAMSHPHLYDALLGDAVNRNHPDPPGYVIAATTLMHDLLRQAYNLEACLRSIALIPRPAETSDPADKPVTIKAPAGAP